MPDANPKESLQDRKIKGAGSQEGIQGALHDVANKEVHTTEEVGSRQKYFLAGPEQRAAIVL